MINPLVMRAVAARHRSNPNFMYMCKECGWTVSSYQPCEILFKYRPAARGWDNWLACDNKDCKHARGQGNTCDLPPWAQLILTL